jgi:L-alanine-DL-glutamate epimerase-like enolase superfamily enzyme
MSYRHAWQYSPRKESALKITDLKCAVIGENPIVRIVTDQGIDGYGEIENTKPYLKPQVLYYRDAILGEDPTDVERVMRRIRRRGAFKPWGSAVSAIEMALWDVAGKSANLPLHKLLGGKVRDKVRCYNGGIRFPMQGHEPQHYAENMQKMREAKEGFTLIKQGIGFHSQMPSHIDRFFYGDAAKGGHGGNRGLLSEKALNRMVRCVEAMKDVLKDDVALALDCGPGWMIGDAIRFAKAIEPFNVAWIEDILTGDYVPYVNAQWYRELTTQTSTPTHTGEQIYLRQNFKDLIEHEAVRVVGPDPADVGGLAELKWIAEYADLHGILMAPHGVFDGVFGLAGLVQTCAAMPDNYVAFEYPVARPDWWYQIVDGLPDPIVEQGFIKVWDRPGLGVTFNVAAAKKHLQPEDKEFFE